ncbi:MAG: type II toxin-antitoxin system VapB family antitoxin [Bryobacterales bacterium]|nr:type II toxin-antitoxin system VapB family antitoxin [Bryobacterales bacterium]
MSLNIKNPEAQALATQLSSLTGESLTTAVIVALRERLTNQQRQRGAEGKSERIMQMAKKFAAGMTPGSRSEDHANFLFGEDGLPR